MPKALVVADSEWVTNDVHATLTSGDWEVEILTDPYQSVSKVVESRPDVVIVDLQVKNMGGMAVIREIRDGLSDGDIPRLVLLLDRTADSFLAKRAGADAWVVKPFQVSELRQALESV